MAANQNEEVVKGADGDTWVFWTDLDGDHWWRRKAPNGNIVGGSTEGYRNKAECLDNARRHGFAPAPK